jgi:UrcA family protein
MKILNSIPRTTCWSAAFTSIACLLGAAQAGAAPTETRSETVSYRDLDLSTIEGATTLYQRLKSAARHVCDEPGANPFALQEWRSCYDAAMADAVAKVNNALLTTLYRGPGKQPASIAMVTK